MALRMILATLSYSARARTYQCWIGLKSALASLKWGAKVMSFFREMLEELQELGKIVSGARQELTDGMRKLNAGHLSALL